MLKKMIFIFIIPFSLFAKECSPYFNPKKFYDVPEYLIEFFETHLNHQKIFVAKKYYQEGFQPINNAYQKKDNYIVHGDYNYPIKSGVWKYTLKNGVIDEINIAQAEIYRYKDEEIANTINEDMENFWADYIEDGYSMQLTPEQTLFRYNGEYFTFSVFIYGVLGDATPLKGTVVNFWLKNYTDEVNKHIQCMQKNKK